MKTSMRLAALSCLVFVLTMPAVAQMVRVDVPFAFQVNESSLPAGTYTVSVDPGSRSVIVHDRDGKGIYSIYLTTVMPVERKSALVFHKYGEHYFLREVRTESGSSVRMPETRAERFVQRASLDGRGPTMTLVRVTVH